MGDRVRALRNVADGVLDPMDYMDIDEDYRGLAVTSSATDRLRYDSLKFFSIVPTIVRGVIGAYSKAYTEYVAMAVNPEVTNDILEKMNDELRSVLVSGIEQLFLKENADLPDEQLKIKHEMFMQSEQVVEYFNKKFRTEAELWASHSLNVFEQKYKLRTLEQDVLKQILVTDCPAVHIDYTDGIMNPELIDERWLFYLRSKTQRDLSESAVVGWFDFMTYQEVVNRWGSRMSQEDAERLAAWCSGPGAALDMRFDHTERYHKTRHAYEDSKINKLMMNQIIDRHASKNDGNSPMSRDLMKVTTIYFYVPRKVGFLSVKNDGEFVVEDELVDELYVPNRATSIYTQAAKTKDTLLTGEHVDWFYTLDLYRGRKLAPSSLFKYDGMFSTAVDGDEVWLELDRVDIILADKRFRHGKYIPVHGGPSDTTSSGITSVVALCEPFQVIYNWLLNRADQLMQTEIGKFHAMPEQLIPGESLDESWSQNSLNEFANLARNTGVAPLSNRLNSNGGSAAALSIGAGQTIDLTATADVLQKTNLAQIFRQLCYETVGLNLNQMVGDFAPSQSARSVAMGADRTATQLATTFTRTSDVMVRVLTTMTEISRQMAVENPSVEMVYTTNQGSRALFRIGSENLMLSEFGIFIKSNRSDLEIIERIKTYVSTNNTIGADAEELTHLMTFTSVPELLDKLAQVRRRRQKDAEEEHRRNMEIEQARIDAEATRQAEELRNSDAQKALDRENDVMVAQIKAMGYANDDAAGIQQAILDIQTANERQRALYQRQEFEKQQAAAQLAVDTAKIRTSQENSEFNRQVMLKQLAQRDRELNLKEQDIKARNIRSEAID